MDVKTTRGLIVSLDTFFYGICIGELTDYIEEEL